jgi:hypothetical protein
MRGNFIEEIEYDRSPSFVTNSHKLRRRSHLASTDRLFPEVIQDLN